MGRLLMVLCPPRSFSSLVSTMIGQHPEIYGFPELHFMVRETVGQVLEWERRRDKYLGPPGYLRALGELQYGGQGAEEVMDAANWLEEREHWKSKRVMDHLFDLATEVTGAPYCLEKTPTLAFLPMALERVRRSWPDALYIHVTRHPVNLKKSMDEYIDYQPRLSEEQKKMRRDSSMMGWPVTQRNLLDFCQSLAPGQYIRIRGEDVLSDAENVMRQVAEWLDIRTDAEAIAAMLRPEESSYATVGPPTAPFGNDPKFCASPTFRPGTPRLGNMDAYFETEDGKRFDPARQAYLRQLANCLGYR